LPHFVQASTMTSTRADRAVSNALMGLPSHQNE
jgi:hypothetical protein